MGALERLHHLTVTARLLLETVALATADVPKLRERMIAILDQQLVEASNLAAQASTEPAKGGGGVSPKIQYCRLVGYIAQVLDGVCSNVEMSELNNRLEMVEKALRDVEKSAAKGR